jgi:hypothetical protein
MQSTDPTLILRPTGKRRSKGEVYEVLLDGEVIASGPAPECGACRALKDRGYDGHAFFWREGKRNYDLKLPIEWAAGKYVAEDKTGIRFAKWSPFTFRDEDELEAA